MGLVAVRVQAAPQRPECLERLLPLLEGLPVEVVMDDGPSPPNPWRGYQLCLQDPPEGCSHLLVLQEDTVVCANFATALYAVITARPDDVVSLFVGGLRNRTSHDFMQALATGKCWVPIYFRDIAHVVALVWPIGLISSFLEWAAITRLPGMPNPRSDDAVVGHWARTMQRSVMATVPCLVEHPDDTPSTIGRRSSGGADRGRVALHYIGDGDPLQIDWGAT